MHPAHHICLSFCVFLLDTFIYLKAYGEVFWLQLFTSMAWNWWVLKIANLQSWVKSEFCTLSPTECRSCGFGTAMTPPLTPPWSMLFTGCQKWFSHTLTLFSWGKGKVFVVASNFKSFILKQDMAKSIFLNIFVQDCSCLMGYSRKNPHPHDGGDISPHPPPHPFHLKFKNCLSISSHGIRISKIKHHPTHPDFHKIVRYIVR